MYKNFLQFEQSGWWMLLLIILAAGLTWYLYSLKKSAWNPIQNLILGVIRFVAIFFSLFLLLEPFINQTITRTEKPIVAIAVDNSQSITARSSDSLQLKSQFESIERQLNEAGMEVRTFLINDDDSLNFDQATTDISSLQKKVESEMEGRNWVATLLFSDGIFNKGSSPVYRQYAVPQFTIGLGDTIPPRDINISRVRYNRVSFKGNDTPIQVEVTQEGFTGRQITLNLTENGKRLDQKNIMLTQSVQEVEFIVKSDEEGLRKMEISTRVLEDEFVSENNTARIFMEVIDGRQKVLIVAEAPHPDISAIRSALSATDNYQTEVYIPSISERVPTEIYDVVVYHGAFSGRTNYTPKESPGIWYILNDRSSQGALRNSVSYLNIRRRGSQPDRVTGSFSQSFSKFKVPEDQSMFEDFPPISVPFGEYILSGPAEILLYQRIGSIVTKKPLFVFYDDGSQKSAVLAGQNIWKWKLQESAINGNSLMFRDLVTKTVQFLSLKNDKQQFQFRSRGNNFSNLEPVTFDAEVYNDIYERIYGNRISLKITDENGDSQDFEFTDSEFNSTFGVPVQKSGVYSYIASVNIGDRTFRDRGQFLVEEINKEFQNLTADHNLLKVMSLKTGGEYFHHTNIDQVMGSIAQKEFKSLVRSTDSFFPLIQNSWILLTILLLFSSEWLLRKYWGGY